MREERGLGIVTAMVAVVGLLFVGYLVFSVVGGITDDIEEAVTGDPNRIAKCQVQLENLAEGKIGADDLIERCEKRDQVEIFCLETPARRQGDLSSLCSTLEVSK